MTSVRKIVFVLSISMSAYGSLPYRYAFDQDVSKANHIIVHQQECGCPCPNGSIVKGKMIIPPDTLKKYPKLHKDQINTEINDFEYNYETGTTDLYLVGSVVGVDTIQCDPLGCEVAPRFKVTSWKMAGYVARVWTFDRWLAIVFAFNLVFITVPFLAVEVISGIRRVWKTRVISSKQ